MHFLDTLQESIIQKHIKKFKRLLAIVRTQPKVDIFYLRIHNAMNAPG